MLERIRIEPFNAVATAIFVLAILHTFAAARFAKRAHTCSWRTTSGPRRRVGRLRRASRPRRCTSSGEVEVVFGLWAVVLLVAMVGYAGWDSAEHYFNDSVNYTEPLFVVVIMALAATRPIVGFAEASLRRVAHLGGATPAAWWADDPDHRPAAGFVHHRAGGDDDLRAAAGATVLRPPAEHRLKYATLGLLFVNVSIGGTLTHSPRRPC